MNQKTAIDFIEKLDWLGEAGDAIQLVVITHGCILKYIT